MGFEYDSLEPGYILMDEKYKTKNQFNESDLIILEFSLTFMLNEMLIRYNKFEPGNWLDLS